MVPSGGPSRVTVQSCLAVPSWVANSHSTCRAKRWSSSTYARAWLRGGKGWRIRNCLNDSGGGRRVEAVPEVENEPNVFPDTENVSDKVRTVHPSKALRIASPHGPSGWLVELKHHVPRCRFEGRFDPDSENSPTYKESDLAQGEWLWAWGDAMREELKALSQKGPLRVLVNTGQELHVKGLLGPNPDRLIFLAEDQASGCEVALKVRHLVTHEDFEGWARPEFDGEARKLQETSMELERRRLAHLGAAGGKHWVSLTPGFEETISGRFGDPGAQECPCIVEELIRGEGACDILWRMKQQGPNVAIDIVVLKALMRGAVEALQEAWALGYWFPADGDHGPMSSDVMLPVDSSETVKVIDTIGFLSTVEPQGLGMSRCEAPPKAFSASPLIKSSFGQLMRDWISAVRSSGDEAQVQALNRHQRFLEIFEGSKKELPLWMLKSALK